MVDSPEPGPDQDPSQVALEVYRLASQAQLSEFEYARLAKLGVETLKHNTSGIYPGDYQEDLIYFYRHNEPFMAAFERLKGQREGIFRTRYYRFLAAASEYAGYSDPITLEMDLVNPDPEAPWSPTAS